MTRSRELSVLRPMLGTFPAPVPGAWMDVEGRDGMTTQTSEETLPEVRELSAEEGAKLFDETARKLLGISGSEFLVRWDRGEYAHETDRMAVTKVAMLIPFAR